MKKILFFRNFTQFSGGHLKVYDYFNHILKIGGFEPRICFVGNTFKNKQNPWINLPEYLYSETEEWRPDMLFVAGMDWHLIPEKMKGLPKINFIQHVRHGNPEHPLYAFLENEATRICVSEQVHHAIRDRAKGSISTISNGINLSEKPIPFEQREFDLFICGIKNRHFAKKLEKIALEKGLKVFTNLTRIPRNEYLSILAQSKKALLLPNITEGFYLPSLEAMALGVLSICPDVVGNQCFSFNAINCIMPSNYDIDSCSEALEKSLELDKETHQKIISYGYETAYKHSLVRERELFKKVLNSFISKQVR